MNMASFGKLQEDTITIVNGKEGRAGRYEVRFGYMSEGRFLPITKLLAEGTEISQVFDYLPDALDAADRVYNSNPQFKRIRVDCTRRKRS